ILRDDLERLGDAHELAFEGRGLDRGIQVLAGVEFPGEVGDEAALGQRARPVGWAIEQIRPLAARDRLDELLLEIIKRHLQEFALATAVLLERLALALRELDLVTGERRPQHQGVRAGELRARRTRRRPDRRPRAGRLGARRAAAAASAIVALAPR